MCKFLRSVSRHADHESNMCALLLTLFTSSRHGPRSRNMCASFSGVSPVWNRRRQEGELWIACKGTGVSTGVRAQRSPIFCGIDQGVHTCVQVVFTIMLGSAHDGQPTMILQVSFRMRKKEREKEKKRRCTSVIIL